MLIDPAVQALKFDRELARLRSQEALLTSRGCSILEAKDSHVDVLFLPRSTVMVSFQVPTPQQGMIQLARPAQAWASGQADQLMVRPFVARFSFDDFDVRAPSVTFRHHVPRDPLKAQEVPLGHLKDGKGTAQLVVLNEHPKHKRPFLCLRGVREYHEHPQHTGDDWFLYRNTIGLFHLVELVWRTCVQAIRPRLLFQPGGVQVRWEVEQGP